MNTPSLLDTKTRVLSAIPLLLIAAMVIGLGAHGSLGAKSSDPDVNNDGRVTSRDMAILTKCFGADPKKKQACPIKMADLNGDGNVDVRDLQVVVEHWDETGFPIDDNIIPLAEAGRDQTVGVGTTVQLDGSGSTDDDGNPLTFQWTITSAPSDSGATLSDKTAVNPSFVLDLSGTYVIQLIVNDGIVDGLPDVVIIDTTNSPPVADAGPGESVRVGDLVHFDGSGSTDVDGNALSVHWEFGAKPAGSTTTLSDPTAINPTFVADQSGTYVVLLSVNDGTVNSVVDLVSITTSNAEPLADAGPDQTAFVSQSVLLDGTGSNDHDGDSLTFRWSVVSAPSGSGTSLSSPTSPTPNFTVDVSGNYVVQLIVNDGFVDSIPTTVVITTHNSKAVAHAGSSQIIPRDSTVTLDGSKSRDVDNDPLTYNWSLLVTPEDSTAILSNHDSVQPTFVTDLPGTYVAQLMVGDGLGQSMPDTVTISSVTQDSQAANSGTGSLTSTGREIIPKFSASPLKGTAPLTVTFADESTGPILEQRWEFSDSTASAEQHPTHTFDRPGTYHARLIVKGHDGSEASFKGAPITVYPEEGAPLLFEAFNDAGLAGWQVVDEGKWQGPSQWSAVAGSLQQTSNIWSPPADPNMLPKLGTYLLYGPGMEWEAYRLTAKLGSQDDDAIGVMFRYQDERNYYRFSWDRERELRRLVKQVKGVFVPLAEERVPYVLGQEYIVDILASRTFLEVRIDDEAIFGGPIQDASLSKGSIAFYSWYNNGGWFDDLSVLEIEGTSKSALRGDEEPAENGEDTP